MRIIEMEWNHQQITLLEKEGGERKLEENTTTLDQINEAAPSNNQDTLTGDSMAFLSLVCNK